MTRDMASLIAAVELAMCRERWPDDENLIRVDRAVVGATKHVTTYRSKKPVPPRTQVVLANDGYVRKATKRDGDTRWGVTISEDDYIDHMAATRPTPDLERGDMDEHTYRQRAADEVEAWYRRQVALGLQDRAHEHLVSELVRQMRTGKLAGWGGTRG